MRQASRRQRAVTLVEGLVAMAIGLMVLGLLYAFSGSVERMSRHADLSGALQEGVLAMAQIEQDLTHAVQRPDASLTGAVRVSAAGFQLIRGDFRPDGSIAGRPVSYRRLEAGRGQFRLARKSGTERKNLPGTFRSIRFAQLEGAGLKVEGDRAAIVALLSAIETPPNGFNIVTP